MLFPISENKNHYFRTISGNPRQFNYRDESARLCMGIFLPQLKSSCTVIERLRLKDGCHSIEHLFLFRLK